jgi:hypothetical protein
MLKIHLLSKASTFALMGLFASVVITPCFAMESEDKETSSVPTPQVMKEEEKPAPTPQLPRKTSEEMEKERREEIQKKVSSIHQVSEEKIAPLVQQIHQIRQESVKQPNLDSLLEQLVKAQQEALNKQRESEKQVAILTGQINEIQKEREAALKPFFPEISKTRAQDFMKGLYKDRDLNEDDEGLSILTGLPTLKRGNRSLKTAYTYIFNQGVKIQDPSKRKQFLKKNFFVDVNSQTKQFRLNALKEFCLGLESADQIHQYVVHMECDGMLKQEVQQALKDREFRIRRGNMQSLLPCLYRFTKVTLVD